MPYSIIDQIIRKVTEWSEGNSTNAANLYNYIGVEIIMTLHGEMLLPSYHYTVKISYKAITLNIDWYKNWSCRLCRYYYT